jgi:hypothetical protein
MACFPGAEPRQAETCRSETAPSSLPRRHPTRYPRRSARTALGRQPKVGWPPDRALPPPPSVNRHEPREGVVSPVATQRSGSRPGGRHPAQTETATAEHDSVDDFVDVVVVSAVGARRLGVVDDGRTGRVVGVRRQEVDALVEGDQDGV